MNNLPTHGRCTFNIQADNEFESLTFKWTENVAIDIEPQLFHAATTSIFWWKKSPKKTKQLDSRISIDDRKSDQYFTRPERVT